MIREFNKSSSDDRPGPGICGSKYVEDEKAARSVRVLGSGTTKQRSTDRRINRASSDAGPELAGREGHAAMESPQALIAPLERGSGGLKQKRVLRRTSEDSPEERQLPTLPPGLAVPSAMTGLASLFGMGRGGSPSL